MKKESINFKLSQDRVSATIQFNCPEEEWTQKKDDYIEEILKTLHLNKVTEGIQIGVLDGELTPHRTYVIAKGVEPTDGKDAVVTYKDGKIAVGNHLIIDGDVGIETGNIEFDGSFTVQGIVQSGFSVKATKDISILGGLQNLASQFWRPYSLFLLIYCFPASLIFLMISFSSNPSVEIPISSAILVNSSF